MNEQDLDNGKKSWVELQQAVKKSHRSALSVFNRNPHNFTFKHVDTDTGPSTRLYFLGVNAVHGENTLRYVDVPHTNHDANGTLAWQPLLDSLFSTGSPTQLSKEEQLLRERKRLRSLGITSYDYSRVSSTFVFSASNTLFTCCDAADNGKLSEEPLLPKEVKTSLSGSRMDCKLCPRNPSNLAFIRDSDIWVANSETCIETRLTFALKGEGGIADDPCSAGVPSYVTQEEFDRYTGYWWQPAKNDDKVYRILYEEVDESCVQIITIGSHDTFDTTADSIRYPRAGTSNAKSALKLVEFQTDDNGNVVNLVEKHMCASLGSLYPGMEYMIRAGWTPDGSKVFAELMDRKQKLLTVLLIPLNCFVASENANIDTDVQLPSQIYPQVIYEEYSDVWMRVHDAFHFLPQENDTELSFIRASERTGFLHLYLVTVRLDGLTVPDKVNGDSKAVSQETPLTSGEWEVDGKQIWVDEAGKLVYFLGTKDTPLESHLYVTSYGSSGSAIYRLTELGFSHTIEVDKECSMFVSIFSSLKDPPMAKVYQLRKESFEPVCLASLLTPVDCSHPAPELFVYPGEDGVPIHGMLFKPQCDSVSRVVEDMPGYSQRKYPVILFVYGGPQVQLVTNAFKATRFLRAHTLASLGYAVVVVDSRGSYHRGLKFEGHLYRRMGQVEIKDQVDALLWLAENTPFLDTSRVAIHGWSYGGYMALLGLAQRPDIFKVAVAGAPVTCWRLYDTGYTERYMDTPENNEDGYKAGSILEHVERFPNEAKRLLIVHGLIDENVHFHHTSALITALIKAGKPYQLQIYPKERHGIRNPNSNEHHETMLLCFLQSNL